MNRIDQLTHNVEAICVLLPEITAATDCATPGSALAQVADAAYEHLWSELIAQSAQVERKDGWWMSPISYRRPVNQQAVADRLLHAIEREMCTGMMDDELRHTLRELAVQLRNISNTLPHVEREGGL